MKRAYIEISNACNLSCSFCPSPDIKGQRQWMTQELFETTLDSLTGIVNEVYLHVLGEPLLHPLLGDFLQTAAQKEMQVNLTTNGLLIQTCAPTLLKSPALRQINFSLHGLQELPSTEQAIVCLNEILNFVQQAAEKRPDLYINLRLWNEGDEQSTELTEWNALVRHHLRDILQVDIPDQPIDSRKNNKPLYGRIYLHSDTRFQWPEGSGKTTARPYGTCRALKTHCAILADGRIVACCLDYQGRLGLGHIQKEGISAALNSPRAHAMRRGFARRELVESFCQHCSFCQRFD